MEDTESSDFLSSCDSVGSSSNSTTTSDQERQKYVDFDVFLTDPMEESSNKTEEDFENSRMIPNSRLTSADHPVLIRLENEYQARRSYWQRRAGQHLLYQGEVEGRSTSTDQTNLTNGRSVLKKKQDNQRKHYGLQGEGKLEAPQGLKRQRQVEEEMTSNWWRDKEEANLQVSEGDRIFAQKCRELQGFIKPLTDLLNGLKRGRYERGLSSFQQSVAMDRIQRIVGVLQKPEMGERYLGTLLQVEMMLKVWFPEVASSLSSFSSSSSDYDMEEPKYKMAKQPEITPTEKSGSDTRPSLISAPAQCPTNNPTQAAQPSDCACCKDRAQVQAQWPNMNMTWMHTAPICNPPLSQVDLHHLNRALGRDLFGPDAPSCGIIFFVQNNQPSSLSTTVTPAQKPTPPLTHSQGTREELPLRSRSAPAAAQRHGAQTLEASKPHSHSLHLLPTCSHTLRGSPSYKDTHHQCHPKHPVPGSN